MNLKDIAAVSGKPGLFRVLKPTRSGVILETLDEKKQKIVTNANYRVSILKEISIYTTTVQGSVPLAQVFEAIREKYGEEIDVEVSDNRSLMDFIQEIVPEYDADRVYASDVKKLVVWYRILSRFAADIFSQSEEEVLASEAVETEETQTQKA
jgi:Domain of unknown function (DUF5606)